MGKSKKKDDDKPTKSSLKALKAEEKRKNGTKIVRCSCHSPFQDATYGENRRVANIGPTRTSCTVCGAQHSSR